MGGGENLSRGSGENEPSIASAPGLSSSSLPPATPGTAGLPQDPLSRLLYCTSLGKRKDVGLGKRLGAEVLRGWDGGSGGEPQLPGRPIFVSAPRRNASLEAILL